MSFLVRDAGKKIYLDSELILFQHGFYIDQDLKREKKNLQVAGIHVKKFNLSHTKKNVNKLHLDIVSIKVTNTSKFKAYFADKTVRK